MSVEIFAIENLEQGDPLARFDPSKALPQGLPPLPKGYVISGGERKFVLYRNGDLGEGEFILLIGPEFAVRGVYEHSKMDRWLQYYHQETEALCRELGGGKVLFSFDGEWSVTIGGKSGAFGEVPRELMLKLLDDLREAFRMGVNYNPYL